MTARDAHLRWLLELTQIPTAAGREWRVVEWIRRWAAARPDLTLVADAAGNLTLAPRTPWPSASVSPPLLITAHLDHPAFVVERIVAPGVVEVAFRGGVMAPYFERASIRIHSGGRSGAPSRESVATLAGVSSPAGAPFTRYLAELGPDGSTDAPIAVGDVATWELPPAEIDDAGIVHTHACDDLAALAAALSAFDELRGANARGEPVEDVRLLFTRSEEIGFTGAIAACKLGTIPAGSRILALENSRSFADSPIGGGPIVRVGDRMSVFEPRLTAACAKRAEELVATGATSPAGPPGGSSAAIPFKYQRKLMAGGACEATVFCAYGHQATCLCLPLGNYHNMADLQGVQDGTRDAAALGPARVAREFIHAQDYHMLVDLLIALGGKLPIAEAPIARLESLYARHASVLSET